MENQDETAEATQTEETVVAEPGQETVSEDTSASDEVAQQNTSVTE